MKKILVVTTRPLESNTSSTIRKISTIEALLEEGADISVLTTHNSYDLENTPETLENIKTIRINPGVFYKTGIQTQRTETRLNRVKKVLRRVYYKFSVYDPLKNSIKNVMAVKNELDNHYDIILSISDPKSSHLLAIDIINRGIVTCDKYIQIWGDPMYLDITNTTLIPKIFIKHEEKKIIEKADKIYYVSPLTLREEQKTFPKSANKMDVLIPLCKETKKYKNAEKIKKLGYFGDYNSDIRDIKPLYNAIENSEYELIICGNSDIVLEEKDNIKINKRLPYKTIKKLESEVDMLIHLSNNKGTQIPGKIYQYFGTNKAILFILDGDSEAIVEFFEPLNRVVFSDNRAEDIIKKISDYNRSLIKTENTPITKYDSKYYKGKILDI